MERSFNEGVSQSRNASQNNQGGTQNLSKALADLPRGPTLAPAQRACRHHLLVVSETAGLFPGFGSWVRTPGGEEEKVIVLQLFDYFKLRCL